MSTQHTPTPWVADDGDGDDWMIGAESNGACVATLFRKECIDTANEAEANAAFIVLACNSHDALVAALRDAESILGDTTMEHLQRVYQSRDIIRAALAAVTE